LKLLEIFLIFQNKKSTISVLKEKNLLNPG
jgi:hypothetical protein